MVGSDDDGDDDDDDGGGGGGDDGDDGDGDCSESPWRSMAICLLLSVDSCCG